MLGLPKTTEVNKRIPKQTLHNNMRLTPVLKRVLTAQVDSIYWRNKIADDTMNLGKGNTVTEIQIFEIRLNSSNLNTELLRQIDKQVYYHVLFLLEYKGEYQAWIAHKEKAQTGDNAFKVYNYYHTDRFPEEQLRLKLEGMNLDTVYENYVRQIGGKALEAQTSGESLGHSIERDKKRQKLQREIAVLGGKVRREKQFNKQVDLNSELKKLKKLLEDL